MCLGRDGPRRLFQTPGPRCYGKNVNTVGCAPWQGPYIKHDTLPIEYDLFFSLGLLTRPLLQMSNLAAFVALWLFSSSATAQIVSIDCTLTSVYSWVRTRNGPSRRAFNN